VLLSLASQSALLSPEAEESPSSELRAKRRQKGSILSTMSRTARTVRATNLSFALEQIEKHYQSALSDENQRSCTPVAPPNPHAQTVEQCQTAASPEVQMMEVELSQGHSPGARETRAMSLHTALKEALPPVRAATRTVRNNCGCQFVPRAGTWGHFFLTFCKKIKKNSACQALRVCLLSSAVAAAPVSVRLREPAAPGGARRRVRHPRLHGFLGGQRSQHASVRPTAPSHEANLHATSAGRLPEAAP
jgi:hypothetical protein